MRRPTPGITASPRRRSSPAAAENLTIIEAGGTVSSADQTSMLQRLNFIAKQWQGKADMAQGLKVHGRASASRSFSLKGSSATRSDRRRPTRGHCAVWPHDAELGLCERHEPLRERRDTDTTTYPGTTVSMTSGDIIGVVLNDGTISLDDAGSGTPSVFAGHALRGAAGAAAAGNFVYWFTSRAQRFPISSTRRSGLRHDDFGEATDIPLFVFRDVQSYEALPDKTADGDPTALLVEPQRLNTAITLDCQPNDVTKVVNLAVLYPAEDYDATSDDIAFPQEWFAALEWELTLRCAPLFGPRAAGYFVMGRK
jgi:hypothetical protein